MKKQPEKNLYEGFIDDITGSSSVSVPGYSASGAAAANFEKEFQNRGLRSFISAWKNGGIDLQKTGIDSQPFQEPAADQQATAAQAPAAQAPAQADPNEVLKNQKLLYSIQHLANKNPNELKKIRDVLAKQARRKVAESDLDEGVMDTVKSWAGKAASGAKGLASKAVGGIKANAPAVGKFATKQIKNLPKTLGKAVRATAKGVGGVGSVPQAFGRAVKHGYQAGLGFMGRGPMDFPEVLRFVAALNPAQSKSLLGYVDSIILGQQSGRTKTKAKAKAGSKVPQATAATLGLNQPAAAAAPAAATAPAAAPAAASKPASLGAFGTKIGSMNVNYGGKPVSTASSNLIQPKYPAQKLVLPRDKKEKVAESIDFQDKKFSELNKLFESIMQEESDPDGVSVSEMLYDHIKKQMAPWNPEKNPIQKRQLAKALLRFETAFRTQVNKARGTFDGKFNSNTQKEFDALTELLSSIAFATLSSKKDRYSYY